MPVKHPYHNIRRSCVFCDIVVYKPGPVMKDLITITKHVEKLSVIHDRVTGIIIFQGEFRKN